MVDFPSLWGTLKEWQGLIAGSFQLVAAALAYWAVMRQTAAQRTEHTATLSEAKRVREEHRQAAENALKISVSVLREDLDACRSKLTLLDTTTSSEQLRYQLLLCKAPPVSALALAVSQSALLENPLTLTAVHVLTYRLAAFNELVDVLVSSPEMKPSTIAPGDTADWLDELLSSIDKVLTAASRVG